jgi:hypothetical protein
MTKKQVSLPVHLFSPVSMILPILHTRILFICHWHRNALAVESVVKQTLQFKSFEVLFHQQNKHQFFIIADQMISFIRMWNFIAVLKM